MLCSVKMQQWRENKNHEDFEAVVNFTVVNESLGTPASSKILIKIYFDDYIWNYNYICDFFSFIAITRVIVIIISIFNKKTCMLIDSHMLDI